MFSTNRIWQVGEVESKEDLAKRVTETTWTLCTGFFVKGHEEYLFLNDSTSEDAIQEYAIVKGGLEALKRQQIETITFGWCSFDQAFEFITDILDGGYDEGHFTHEVSCVVQALDEHEWCPLCA